MGNLFSDTEMSGITSRHQELEAHFEEFHEGHPEVWNHFEKFTFQIIDRGFKNYAVNSIMELIRWHTDKPDVNGKSIFKSNNNHHPFYARMFMKKYPEHDGFFRIRNQISKEQPAICKPALTPDDFPYTTMKDE